MEIINPDNVGDFHIHSSTFSDGFNSIDEIVVAAGKLGYQKIAFTDHSQALLDAYGMTRKTHYDLIDSGRWTNIHNDVNVTFGVEADILNENGDICDHIQGITPDFILLSAHRKVYSGDLKQIKRAYLNAIERFGKSINVLGHLCTKQFAQFLSGNDIIEIVKAANYNKIALELNCANLVYDKTDLDNLKIMLDHANYLYVNSDTHTMNEFIELRKKGFQFLKS
ncbi:MAG: PHP domain-containing protein [Candidatus Marinimicrobia bacterium]|nr:PHP domain-containing protein [Candidatus Neomarinimicrobiota bacterium]